MLPKEHGAWNALLVSLAAGWIALGQWSPAALAASLLWLSGFILRAPLSTWRQYRIADPAKARKALGFSAFLFLVLLLSGLAFFQTAPLTDARVAGIAALPLGAVLFILAAVKRSLRFLAAEVPAFAGITLAAPVVFLSSPSNGWKSGLWLYAFLSLYFILALFYVKVRQGWVARAREGFRPGFPGRFFQGGMVLFLHVLFIGGVALLAPSRAWVLGPLYAGLRVLAGLGWGRADLPIRKLGIREMVHSLVFMVLTLFAWKFL